MTTETVDDPAFDDLATRAAAALHGELTDLDTDAALERVLAGEAPTSLAASDRGGRPGRWLAVAAVLLAVAGLAAVLVTRGDDPKGLETTEAPEVDVTSYGPLLGELQGVDNPDLHAEVYGPELMDGTTDLGVRITGATPGRTYSVSRCATRPDANPAGACGWVSDLVVAEDGTAEAVVRLAAVFGGMGWPARNDCRTDTCELQISPLIENDESDQGIAGTFFVDPDGPWYLDPQGMESPWIQLRWAEDAAVPALPSMTMTPLPGDGSRVRIEGRDLAPGRARLEAHGYDEEPLGMMVGWSGIAVETFTTFDVAADGTFAVEVALPESMVEAGATSINDVPQPPRTVTCADAPWSCQVWLSYDGAAPIVDGLPALTPAPLPYPS